LQTGLKTSNQLMINTMKLSIIIPLLFLLSDAAPLADDQALSHPLQKRAYMCNVLWGRDIVDNDCQQAWTKMWNDLMDPQVTRLLSPSMLDELYKIPKRRTVGTCTIIVDSTDPAATLTTSWMPVSDGGRNLIEQCVHNHRLGGETNTLGFRTIVHKNTVDVALYAAQQRQSGSNLVARALEHISGPPSLP